MSQTRKYRRTPRNYDGSQITTHRMTELLPSILNSIVEVHQERPDLILASWPEIIGEKLVSMTQPISFVEGVLTVKVKNSTLYSLLSQNDKARILASLRQKFPKVKIQNIVFRIG